MKYTVVAESRRIPIANTWEHSTVAAAKLLGASIQWRDEFNSWATTPKWALNYLDSFEDMQFRAIVFEPEDSNDNSSRE